MDLHVWRDADYRGTVIRVDYETRDLQGDPWKKYANVYLPYGYDDAKPYNILYLMHGGGGNPDAWLDCSQIKNVMDRGFLEKRAEPFITVFPTFYSLIPSENRREGIDASWEDSQVRHFQKEFTEDLIPAIEGRFHTYAEKDLSHESLQNSRKHRAFGGFSMGGATTWYNFLAHLDIVSVFMPLSGDCWEIQPMGGRLAPDRTAEALYEKVRSLGFTKDDFRIFVGTGSKDAGCDNLTPQLDAMKEKYPEVFDFSEDPKEGNLHFEVKEDAVHAYEEVYHHVWNYLPYLFI
ncbi:MAG: hypothetical protein IJL78_07800 [Lachnospiraceae bacterium]|nr:hypothetical protein [Lachnospiraceae bacterium]